MDDVKINDVSAINDWNISKTATFNDMFKNVLVHPEFTKIEGIWDNGTFVPYR
jgi:hypothetical protein